MRTVRVRVNGEWYDVRVGDIYQSPVDVEVDGEIYMVELDAAVSAGVRRSEPTRSSRSRNEQAGLRGLRDPDEKIIRCPLPGKVISVSVVKDQTLQAGDEICVLESMKMEQSVRASEVGVAKNIKIKKNQTIGAGDPMIELH